MLIVFLHSDRFPFDPPSVDELPAAPETIVWWISPRLATQEFQAWEVGPAGSETIWQRGNASDPLAEYELVEIRPANQMTRCAGDGAPHDPSVGECFYGGHEESTVFVTEEGRRLCYPAYVAHVS
jgi:hypothetical protein